MKITRARLKQIIQEELERDEGPDFSISGAEDLKRSIAQHQGERGYEPDRLPRLKDELLDLYRQEHEEGPSRGLTNAIGALELEIQDLEI